MNYLEFEKQIDPSKTRMK